MNRSTWRWIVLTLLLANLLFYFWPRPQATVAVRNADVDELKLYQPARPAQSESPVLPTQSAGEVATPAAVLAESVAAPEPVLELKPEPEQCWQVGPLPGGALAELRELIDVQNLQARLIKRPVEAGSDYWVYIDPNKAGIGASSLKAKLSEQGFDSYVIGSGELSGSLSLGLFSSQAGASRLIAEVGRKGITAAVIERQKYRDEFWLVASTGASVSQGWGSDISAFPFPVTETSELESCPW